ncbi:MAG: YdgA family protein [Sedimenticola sp.]|nr:YdgA family protein [Sedimenticola sp.]
MKRFVALFVLLGAILLAAPGVIGFQVQDYYQQLMQELGKGGAKVVAGDYRREWFGARDETRFRVQVPKQPGGKETQTLEFSLVSEIVHGPLTSSGIALAEVRSEIRIEGEALLPADYQASIDTLITITGQGTTRINLPATRIPAKGKQPAMQFDGMQGEMRFDPGFEQVAAELTMPVLTFEQSNGSLLKLQGMRLDSRSQKDASGLMLGGGRFSVDRFELNDTARESRLQIRELSVDAESSNRESGVAAHIRYSLQSLQLDDKTYGPAELKLGLANLSAPALLEIQQSVEAINAQQLSEQEKGAALMSVLMGNAPALLKGDPRLSIDPLRVETPDGLIEGQLSLQSRGLQWQDLGKASVVLGKLAGEGSLRMPEKLFRGLMRQKARTDLLRQFEQRRLADPDQPVPDEAQLEQLVERLSEQQISVLLGQEILVREGDAILTEATLADGLLSVNGKTVPLPVPPEQ